MQLRQIINDETLEYRLVKEALLDASYLLDDDEQNEPLWIYFSIKDGIMYPSFFNPSQKQSMIENRNEEYVHHLLNKAYGSVLRTEWLQPTPKQIEEGYEGYIYIFDDVLNDVGNVLA